MASGSKVAVANTSTYIQGCLSWDANVSGSSIVVNVRFYMRRTNNYSGSTGTSSCNQRICISGDPANYGYSQTDAVWIEGNKQNEWQGPYFSASRTFDASRSGETIYVGWKVDGDSYGYLNGSGNVQITLPTAYQAPATPTVSVSNASGSSNSVTYGTTSFGVPSSGTVYLYGGTSASPTTQIATKTTTGNSTYTHSGLAGNTRYYYRSKASNSQLSSSYSSDASVITRPSNPSSATLVVTGTNTATLTIKAPSMGSAATVTAYYKLNSGSYTSAGTISSGGTITKSLTGLTAGTAYTASVYFSNTSGNSGTVTSSSVTTYKVPQGLTATVTDKYSNGAKLTIGVSNYGTPASTSGRYLEGVISTDNTISSDDWWSETQTNVASATVTITNANIKPNTTYYYGTYAYNTKVSAKSIVGSFVTLPAAPSSASLTVTGETTATLSITAPTMGSASTMTAYYKLNSGSYVSAGTITSGGTITKSLTGLTAGTNYTATVKIANSSGDSATTTTSQVTTYQKPQGLSVNLTDHTTSTTTLNMGISSYGVPNNLAGRYIEAQIAGTSSDTVINSKRLTETTSGTVTLGSSLPSEYQEIEYLQSSGTQYIDTGAIANVGSKLEAKFAYTTTSTEQLNGVQWFDNGGFAFGVVPNLSSTSFTALIGHTSFSLVELDTNSHNTSLEIVSSSQGKFTLDGNSKTESITYTTNNKAIILFARNNRSTIDDYCSMKNYSCKIYDNNTLVRDFIPCYRKSDNKPGLYDLANSGKNLFNTEYEILHQYKRDGVTEVFNAYTIDSDGNISISRNQGTYGRTTFNKLFMKAGTYTISFTAKVDGSSSDMHFGIWNFTDSSDIYAWTNIQNVGSFTYISRTFTISSDCEVGIAMNPTSSESGTLTIKDIQVEKGSIATEYEHYPFYTNAGTGEFVAGPSTGQTALAPNTQYRYRMTANNQQVSASTSYTNFVTKSPLPTYVPDSLVVGVDSASFQVSYLADGGYYPKQVRYSLDGLTYTVATTVTGGSAQTATITITGLSPRTTYNIKIDTYTTAGYTQGYNTVPEFTTKGNCYGSVSGQTKQIINGYCSIGGETAKILKIYGSKDGLTKRVF